MKNSLILIGGLIVVLIPGGLTILFIWAIVFPKHRKKILAYIKRRKGDLKMAMEKIIGKAEPGDQKYAMKVDASGIDSTRIKSADKAFAYVESKHQERMVTFTPALMVGCFGIGAAMIVALWVLATYLPIVG